MIEFSDPKVLKGAGPRVIVFGQKKGFEGYFIVDAAHV